MKVFYPRMYRSIIRSKEGQLHKKELDHIVHTFTCPDCNGTRLNAKIRSCLINGKNICEVSDMLIPEAAKFIRQIDDPLARDIKTEILKRMNALIEIGLGYLSLSRGTDTLSGGEAQRIKIARYINSPLTDMMYVLDEPKCRIAHKRYPESEKFSDQIKRTWKYGYDRRTSSGNNSIGGSYCGYGTGSRYQWRADYVPGQL